MCRRQNEGPSFATRQTSTNAKDGARSTTSVKKRRLVDNLAKPRELHSVEVKTCIQGQLSPAFMAMEPEQYANQKKRFGLMSEAAELARLLQLGGMASIRAYKNVHVFPATCPWPIPVCNVPREINVTCVSACRVRMLAIVNRSSRNCKHFRYFRVLSFGDIFRLAQVVTSFNTL
jgi:hypothetical protein